MIDVETIRAGLAAGEFFLEYMPTIALKDDRCVGAEALIRWRRPSGVVSPQEFIRVAENTPLAGLITYWVIETAATELADWLRDNDDIHLSINVPPEILGRGALEYVATKIGVMDLAKKIVLEITERGVPDNQGVNSIASAAQQFGVRVALDDVSLTGANLIVLSRCNVEIIKLDKAVVGQIVNADKPPVWLAGLSAILQSTKLQVIAEGVETAAQREILRAAGVKMAQGYFFSRPLRGGFQGVLPGAAPPVASLSVLSVRVRIFPSGAEARHIGNGEYEEAR